MGIKVYSGAPGGGKSKRGNLAYHWRDEARPTDNVVMTNVCYPRKAVSIISSMLNYPYPSTLITGVNERMHERVYAATKNGYVLERTMTKPPEPPWQFMFNLFNHQSIGSEGGDIDNIYGRKH
jgi:hypothetical protein